MRPWAKANRYRYRLEQSYQAENSAHVKGDGRWFVEVEVLCQNGIIYPKGELILLAVAKIGVSKALEAIPGVIQRRTDAKSREFEFPLDKLDDVAAILKPRRRRAVVLTPEQVEQRRESLARAREARKTLSPGQANAISNSPKATG